MKLTLSFLFFINIFVLQAQQYSYNFGRAPQSIMLNPSYDIGVEKHFTIPIVGSNQLNIGLSSVTVFDIFSDNNVPFQDKVENAVYNLSTKDILVLNQKMEFINMGYRLKSDDYLTFGMYEELDFYSTIPAEMLQFFFEGNTFPGKQYAINDFAIQADLLTVYHIGLQKNLSSDLSIGGRFKIYNVAADMLATSNIGNIQSNKNEDGSYSHSLNDVAIGIKTSGIGLKLDAENKIVRENGAVVLENNRGDDIYSDKYASAGYIGSRLFIAGSKGIGVDLGATYRLQENISLAVSVTDLGFIYNTKQSKTYTYTGEYVTESLAFEYDPDKPSIYVKRLLDEIDENIPLAVDDSNYISLRPFQLYSAINYSFGMTRNNVCDYYKSVSYNYASNIGAVFHAQNRPEQILYDAGIYYERNFNNTVFARANYTVNKFSNSNIGLAVSAYFWKLNMYAGINDVLAISNLAKTNNLTVNFGINVIVR